MGLRVYMACLTCCLMIASIHAQKYGNLTEKSERYRKRLKRSKNVEQQKEKRFKAYRADEEEEQEKEQKKKQQRTAQKACTNFLNAKDENMLAQEVSFRYISPLINMYAQLGGSAGLTKRQLFTITKKDDNNPVLEAHTNLTSTTETEKTEEAIRSFLESMQHHLDDAYLCNNKVTEALSKDAIQSYRAVKKVTSALEALTQFFNTEENKKKFERTYNLLGKIRREYFGFDQART